LKGGGMKLELDEWAELWFRDKVGRGMHAGFVLNELETFRRSLGMPAAERPALPRIVAQTDRYIIVELATDAAGGSTSAIFCRRCCSTSFNHGDVQQLFCGHCKQFHNSY
jgi:hypothetical protein